MRTIENLRISNTSSNFIFIVRQSTLEEAYLARVEIHTLLEKAYWMKEKHAATGPSEGVLWEAAGCQALLSAVYCR